MKTHDVVFIRHAQSTWNAKGRFTGWANPPLTTQGVAEAERAGRLLRARGFHFDQTFSSRLQRANITARIILGALGQDTAKITLDWRLNERHYGALQGEDKASLMAQVGEAKVWRWRRGYRDTAPALAITDPRHPRYDALYRDLPTQDLPSVESLADTRQRVMTFWHDTVLPKIIEGQRLLIAAHGNTLRALIMDLSGMTEKQVEQFEIPTGQPIVYRFDARGQPLGWSYLRSAAA